MNYTPLQLNALSELLADVGLCINPNALTYIGTSTAYNNYTPGALVSGTVLDPITSSIRLGYTLIGNDPIYNISQPKGNLLISFFKSIVSSSVSNIVIFSNNGGKLFRLSSPV